MPLPIALAGPPGLLDSRVPNPGIIIGRPSKLFSRTSNIKTSAKERKTTVKETQILIARAEW